MVVPGFEQIRAQLPYRASGCSIGLPIVVGTSRGGGGGRDSWSNFLADMACEVQVNGFLCKEDQMTPKAQFPHPAFENPVCLTIYTASRSEHLSGLHLLGS